MSKSTVKLALIGLGNMGLNHLRVASMLKHATLECIYDSDLEKTARLAAQYDTQAAGTLDKVFAHELDAVIICTPTTTHAGYIRAAAPHVKNIFVEKPMAATLEEAQEVCDLVEKHGINLQVGFIERFNPAVQQLKNVLDSAKSVISIDFTRTNKLSARITDVDVIADLMIHDIDLAMHLNGPVRSVFAHGAIDDNLVSFASAIITHENGKFSRIQASRITEKKIRKIEATCEDIFVDCELLRKEIVLSKQSQIHQKDGDFYRVSAVQENIEVKPEEALLLELSAFIDGCRGQSNPITPTAQDGLNALRICHTIQNGIYHDHQKIA